MLNNLPQLDGQVLLTEAGLASGEALPSLAVACGCCGTDIHHIDAISAAFAS